MHTVTSKKSDALIVLVRHGESEGNTGMILSSNIHALPLIERGREQALAVSAELGKLKVDRIVSSPLLRAQQTAGIISDRLGLGMHEITLDYRLRERGFGYLEGTIMDDYSWRFRTGQGIETYDEIANRINSFLSCAKQGVTVAVTHGDTMKAAVLSSLGLDELSGFGIRHYNTNMTIIYVQGEKRSLITFGMPVLDESLLERIPGRFRA